MSANNETGATAVDQSSSWTEQAQVPANDTGPARQSNISAADAFGALADAVTAYINAPQRLKDRRLASLKISELLREAFCLRADTLSPLPKQLGSNFDAASDYIYDQLDRWAAQPSLKSLFDAVNVSPDVGATITATAMRRVPVEEIGVWLSTEFGSLSASREADHCRRYVATKISAALFDLSQAQPSVTLDNPMSLQHQLDDWASPTGGIEQSLHYQMVIAPFLNFFHDIATGRVASTER